MNVRFAIKPERRKDFVAAIKADQEGTLKDEPRALQFVVGESTTEENSFFLHEEYIGEKGFEEHKAAPHFVSWKTFCDSDPFLPGRAPVVDCYYGEHPAVKKDAVPAFCLNVDLYPKAEVRPDFITCIVNNKAGSDNDEPLCTQYVWGESTSTPNTFHFHEEYLGEDGGKEGFNAHTQAPHFAAWEKFAASSPFMQEPAVFFYRTI